jgi:hypothetical protein
MTKVKLVYQTIDKEYEFVGYEVLAKSDGIVFRSTENIKSIFIGNTRFIFNQLYYCSMFLSNMDGKLFAYWTPVYKEEFDMDKTFKELIYLTSETASDNTGFYQ